MICIYIYIERERERERVKERKRHSFQPRMRYDGCDDVVSSFSFAGNTSDPYLTVDFDSFKQFNTEARKKTLNPEWNEDVSFLYETKLAHKVHLKRLKIKCFNQSFLSDKLIGRCYIDLYNIFTGPSEFRLPLRDGQ